MKFNNNPINDVKIIPKINWYEKNSKSFLSFFKKKDMQQELTKKEMILNEELQDLKHKIKLITKNDLDYLDVLYREKLRYGTKHEILIKLK